MWAPLPHDAGLAAFQSVQPELRNRYDFLRNVTDAYLLFSYPFLLSVLDTTFARRIAGRRTGPKSGNAQIHQRADGRRGLQFQLGLWMHGYEWIDSPKPNYTIEG